MKKNILITGADGFIGKRLQKRFISTEYDIITHDIKNGDIASDILEYSDVCHVYHLAALTYVPNSWDNTFEYYRVNTMGVVNVLELCRKTGASLTFLSTYVYGKPHQEFIDEEHDVNPNSPYNHSKVLGENLCEFYNKIFNVDITVLRPFNIYGFGQSNEFLIPSIVSQFLDDNVEIVTVMNYDAKRDYLYIDDLVEAIYKTFECRGYAVYNVGTGCLSSVLDVLITVKRILNSSKPFTKKNVERKNEVTDMAANISKISSAVGWKPLYNLENGLRRMIEEITVAKKNKI